MDPRRFDTLSRELTRARSRRGALTALLGSALGLLSLTETEAKNKRRRKKHKTKQPIPVSPPSPPPSPPPPPSCPSGQHNCQGQCIPTGQCCLDADCGAGKGCFSGRCLTKQGACTTGEDFCAGTPTTGCGNDSDSCLCVTSMQGQTRCGVPQSGCEVGCTTDEQCAARHPAVAGVFCVRGGGARCTDCPSSCFAPCPN
jgi:hypothetical protein